jgi:hypothetical protein
MNAVLERRVVEHLTEPRLEPLVMSDTEIVDWMNEYCGACKYTPASDIHPSRYRVTFFDGEASGPSLRDAVCLADAIWKEVNE